MTALITKDTVLIAMQPGRGWLDNFIQWIPYLLDQTPRRLLNFERVRCGVSFKFLALATKLYIAGILKNELDERAAKYGHFEL